MAQSSAELLQQLRGIHLPPTPPEPALWPLALALAIIIPSIILLLLSRRTKIQWHHQAMMELRHIQSMHKDKQLYALAQLLRRVALTNDANLTTSLTGRAWLNTLDTFFNTRYFSSGDGQIFGSDLYQKPELTDVPIQNITTKVKKLIKYRAWFGV